MYLSGCCCSVRGMSSYWKSLYGKVQQCGGHRIKGQQAESRRVIIEILCSILFAARIAKVHNFFVKQMLKRGIILLGLSSFFWNSNFITIITLYINIFIVVFIIIFIVFIME